HSYFLEPSLPFDMYTLSLHDALPIWNNRTNSINRIPEGVEVRVLETLTRARSIARNSPQLELPLSIAAEPTTPLVDQIQFEARRSEEHTSELQSRENLVCRLLLEKKK